MPPKSKTKQKLAVMSDDEIQNAYASFCQSSALSPVIASSQQLWLLMVGQYMSTGNKFELNSCFLKNPLKILKY